MLAEDLGVVLKDTETILKNYNIPGMNLLQQRIPTDDKHEETHPREWGKNLASYTGTHDSPTIKQWLDEADETQIKYYKNYLNDLNICSDSEIWNFIELTWKTPCILTVTNVQDILELGSEARFNVPGTQKGNWKWRIESLVTLHEAFARLKKLNEETNRFNILT